MLLFICYQSLLNFDFAILITTLADSRRRKRRTCPIVHHKKRRRLLPYTPSNDTDKRLEQMRSLACALTSLNMEYSDDLTYSFDMAPRGANMSSFENGGMQVFKR